MDDAPGLAAMAVAFFLALARRWVALLRFLARASATFFMGLVARDMNLFFICSTSAGGSGTCGRWCRFSSSTNQSGRSASSFQLNRLYAASTSSFARCLRSIIVPRASCLARSSSSYGS